MPLVTTATRSASSLQRRMARATAALSSAGSVATRSGRLPTRRRSAASQLRRKAPCRSRTLSTACAIVRADSSTSKSATRESVGRSARVCPSARARREADEAGLAKAPPPQISSRYRARAFSLAGAAASEKSRHSAYWRRRALSAAGRPPSYLASAAFLRWTSAGGSAKPPAAAWAWRIGAASSRRRCGGTGPGSATMACASAAPAGCVGRRTAMRSAAGRSRSPASSKALISACAWIGRMLGVPSEAASSALASGLGRNETKR